MEERSTIEQLRELREKYAKDHADWLRIASRRTWQVLEANEQAALERMQNPWFGTGTVDYPKINAPIHWTYCTSVTTANASEVPVTNSMFGTCKTTVS